MGMLFARRREKKSDKVTTTKNLLVKEHKKVENVQPKKEAINIPTQHKFKA
jgi:hypothetical protein